jgi:GWxTD domain-containing protein
VPGAPGPIEGDRLVITSKGLIMASLTRHVPFAGLLLSVLTILTAAWPRAAGAVLQPLDGRGSFHSYVEVVNRWRSEERLDVLVLCEVSNADLAFREEDGQLVGRLRVEVRLTGPGGEIVQGARVIRTPGVSGADAASRTLHQVFGVLLEDVKLRSGRLECAVYDENTTPAGLTYLGSDERAVSACAAEWYAEDSPRPAVGLALEQPLFLLGAPLSERSPSRTGALADDGWAVEFAHASRRYGLEQDRLQLVVPVWPAAGGVRDAADLSGLRVQIASQELELALNDTIAFDERGRAALQAGRPASLFYELDLNLLPEGMYQLSLAPLGGRGLGVLTEFPVVWRLDALSRNHDLVLGEGRTVLHGAQLRAFEGASAVERERILEEFWRGRDPDPESPVNEAQVEFRYRLAYVQRFLGGFDDRGARDDRGEVFLLLGQPDEVQRNPVPQDVRDQDDARIKVYNRFAPDREGNFFKGETSLDPLEQGRNPYAVLDPIPMPYSHRAETDRMAVMNTPQATQGFEFWEYNHGGRELFPNRFSNKGMGQRFLFINRNGTGVYELKSSNVVQGEE